MKKFVTIYQHENARGQAEAPYGFDKKFTINDGDTKALSEAVEFDNCTACYKNGYKKSDNFISADCILADIDNDFTDTPSEWITHNNIIQALPNVKFYYYPSRNNMKPKNEKTPRPKEHFIFPIDEVSTLDEYTSIMKKLITSFDYLHFDKAVSGGAQLNFGVEEPNVNFVNGEINLSDFLNNHTSSNEPHNKNVITTEEDIIKEGTRNNTLFHRALEILKQNNDIKTTHELYKNEASKCIPPLDEKEVSKIWKSANKFSQKNNKKTIPTWELPIKDKSAIEALLSLDSTQRKVTIDNIKLILKAFGVTIRKNDMNGIIEVSGLHDKFNEEDTFINFQTIVEDTACKLSFSRNHSKTVYDILYLIASENHYHPVLELLDQNEWDNQYRFEDICNILGIDNDFYKTLFKKWAIQTIALLYSSKNNPVSAQGVLVLQGAQGLGKTEFFRHLAIDNAFFKGGATIDMSNKDSLISATRVWICELGELDSTTKKMQSALKGFLTEHTDRYREPYGRTEKICIRKTSFCGTVNPQQFLHDETGNRRYWIIHVDNIDIDRIFSHSKEWYTQVWLEIREEYRKNPQGYLLTAEEMKNVNNENESFEAYSNGEDEFMTIFDVEADISLWQYKTAAEVTEILNSHNKGLKLNASKFGKDLVPQLEKRLGIKFKQKKIKGANHKLYPPIRREYQSESISLPPYEPIYDISINTDNISFD